MAKPLLRLKKNRHIQNASQLLLDELEWLTREISVYELKTLGALDQPWWCLISKCSIHADRLPSDIEVPEPGSHHPEVRYRLIGNVKRTLGSNDIVVIRIVALNYPICVRKSESAIGFYSSCSFRFSVMRESSNFVACGNRFMKMNCSEEESSIITSIITGENDWTEVSQHLRICRPNLGFRLTWKRSSRIPLLRVMWECNERQSGVFQVHNDEF
jgi:hypothetical protein